MSFIVPINLSLCDLQCILDHSLYKYNMLTKCVSNKLENICDFFQNIFLGNSCVKVYHITYHKVSAQLYITGLFL